MQLLQHASVRVPRAEPKHRATTVRVNAAAEGPFSGLLRIFTPATYLQTKDSFAENSGYKGTIPRGRRPFKDGFAKLAPAPRKPAVAPASTDTGVMSYLNQAAERVIGHNFKGDATEPDWGRMGGRGWKGERRSKQGDGFHSIKL